MNSVGCCEKINFVSDINITDAKKKNDEKFFDFKFDEKLCNYPNTNISFGCVA